MRENLRIPKEYMVTSAQTGNLQEQASAMFRQTGRVRFENAGFSLWPLGRDLGSTRLRQVMLEVLDHLSRFCQDHFGRPLEALSMSRFNQQASTKPHRDSGPPQSLLLLGYEPTPIESQLRIADYSLCAHKMGLTPLEFLDRHNPMFPSNEDLLGEYTTLVHEFDPTQYQILLINNSACAYSQTAPDWLGVLHQATVPNPAEDALRVVNSIQLTLKSTEDVCPVSPNERTQQAILTELSRFGQRANPPRLRNSIALWQERHFNAKTAKERREVRKGKTETGRD